MIKGHLLVEFRRNHELRLRGRLQKLLLFVFFMEGRLGLEQIPAWGINDELRTCYVVGNRAAIDGTVTTRYVLHGCKIQGSKLSIILLRSARQTLSVMLSCSPIVAAG